MITKRQLANDVLFAAGFNTVTSEASTDEFDRCLRLYEQTMLSLSGNESIKIGYIKSDDQEYIDPDVDSGIRDHEAKYCNDIVLVQFLSLYSMPTSQIQMMNHDKAMDYLGDALEPATNLASPLPSGKGHDKLISRDRNYQPQKLDDDDITLIKGGMLDLD